MENRVIKVLMLTGILCVTGITLCACQGIRQVSDESQNQEEVGKVNSEDNAVDNILNEEPDTENPDKGNPGTQAEANDGEINTAPPDLEGTIKDIQGKELTVVEAITQKDEDSGYVMETPAGDDDSEFNKVRVTYDDNTVFVIKNIYDGGARFETENGTVSDLATGQLVEIWGTSAADELQAAEICIVNVVLD